MWQKACFLLSQSHSRKHVGGCYIFWQVSRKTECMWWFNDQGLTTSGRADKRCGTNIEHVKMYVGSIHPLLVCQEKENACQCLPKKKPKQKKPKAWRRNLVIELRLFFLQRKTLGAKTPWLNTISLSSSGAIKVLQTDLGAALPQGLPVQTLLCRQLWFAFTANITAISQVNPSAEEFLSVDSF